jgi:hypothetical protein
MYQFNKSNNQKSLNKTSELNDYRRAVWIFHFRRGIRQTVKLSGLSIDTSVRLWSHLLLNPVSERSMETICQSNELSAENCIASSTAGSKRLVFYKLEERDNNRILFASG